MDTRLKQARKKLNNTFPSQIGCFYYKGLKINKDMFFNKKVKK